MHSREQILDTYDNLLLFLDENFAFNGFVLGFSISMFLLLITVQFIKQMNVLIMFLIAFLTSVFFGFFPEDMTQFLNFLDIPVSIIASFLFLRLCMSISRSINKVVDDDSKRISILIIISLFPVCLLAYIIYNTLEKNYLAIAIYALNALTLIITLSLDNGFISDPSYIILYSISFFSKSDEFSTFISVIRFLFIAFSLLSLFQLFPVLEKETTFLIFRIKRTKVRMLLMLGVASYLYVSPCLMWDHGYNRCIFQAITTPVLYILLFVYEYLQPNHTYDY